ncbi:MAG: hypothetical protein J7499_14615 [Sphingopyxis sp.]|nr:hypothetical protein [Sphingopyxis sp.]
MNLRFGNLLAAAGLGIAAIAIGVTLTTTVSNSAKAQVDSEVDSEVVSVLSYIPVTQHAAIRAGTSRFDVTSAIHAARDKVQGTGKTLLFPPGTYYVGEVVFSGSNYRIGTEGVTFRQKPGLTGDGKAHPIVTFPQDANNIRMGNIRLTGNIATDREEYSHGIAVFAADDIVIGDIHGENIRGDVVYTYGRTTSEAEHQRNLTTGVVTGRNIFRCIVAMAGGDARIAGIVQDGPVGYRDYDAEPNRDGAYQPVTARIGFIRGSVVQITSDDPKVINADIRIERLDLDGNRIADSKPNYPRHPGANAIALSIGRVASVQIGELRVQNYPSYPIALFDLWRSVRIGSLDFHNSNTEETTYKTIVLQHDMAGDGILTINRLTGRLADPSRMVLRSDEGMLKVDVGRMDTAGGRRGLYLTGRIDGVRLKGNGYQ